VSSVLHCMFFHLLFFLCKTYWEDLKNFENLNIIFLLLEQLKIPRSLLIVQIIKISVCCWNKSIAVKCSLCIIIVKSNIEIYECVGQTIYQMHPINKSKRLTQIYFADIHSENPITDYCKSVIAKKNNNFFKKIICNKEIK